MEYIWWALWLAYIGLAVWAIVAGNRRSKRAAGHLRLSSQSSDWGYEYEDDFDRDDSLWDTLTLLSWGAAVSTAVLLAVWIGFGSHAVWGWSSGLRVLAGVLPPVVAYLYTLLADNYADLRPQDAAAGAGITMVVALLGWLIGPVLWPIWVVIVLIAIIASRVGTKMPRTERPTPPRPAT